MSILKLGFIGLLVICPLFIFKTTFFLTISTTIHSPDQAFLEQEVFNFNIFRFHPIVTKIDVLSETPTEKVIDGHEEFKLFGIVVRKAVRRTIFRKKTGGFDFLCPSFQMLGTFDVPYKAEILIEKRGNDLVLTENAEVFGAFLPAFVVRQGTSSAHESMFIKMKEFMENNTDKVN